MTNTLKVDMVSRSIGRYKGQPALLNCDAAMIGRAIDAVKGIAVAQGLDATSIERGRDRAVSTVLETVMDNMETPAIDLLSDFRDTYTSSRARIVEVHLQNASSTTLFGIIPTLTREGTATVRVSRLDVKVLTK